LSQGRIAKEVYGRRDDFDPTCDPIVRMQAGRVRRALEHYYLTEGMGNRVAISLPKGSYAPEIRLNGTSGEPGRNDPARAVPLLLISPFENHSGNEEFEFIAQGLADDLAVALDRYQTARILLLPRNPADDRRAMEDARRVCAGKNCFIVKGQILARSDFLRIIVRLEDASTGVLHWSREYHCMGDCGERDRFLDGMVEQVAACIAEERGAIVQQCFHRLDRLPPHDASAYQALLHLYHAERTSSLECYKKALLALREAVKVAPDDGRLWGGLARICTLNHILELIPEFLIPMEEVIGYARKGVRLTEADQRAWCILAFAETIAGNLERGHEATRRALALNPDSLFFRDVVGYLLILQGHWKQGVALCTEAVEMNPFVRSTAFCGLWLDAFRREKFDESQAWAERYMELKVFWAPLMRAASLAGLGRHGEARASLEHLFLVRPDFRETGPRLIRRGIPMENLARRVEDALRCAGLDFTGDR
jgi:adenylate cyclase